MPFEFLGVYLWYLIAAFLGFFVYRRKRRKEMKGERRLIVVGHRGAAGHSRQNSMESFKKAVEIGVDFVEMDIRASSDGVFFLAHDDHEKTIEGRKIKLSETPADMLRTITLEKNVRLVSLLSIVHFLPSQQKMLLDLKVKGHEFEFLSFLRNHDLIGRVWVSSYYAQSLRLLKVLEPKLIVGLSFPRDRFNIIFKILFSPLWIVAFFLIKYTYPFYLGVLSTWARADFISVQFRIILSKRLVESAHKRGLLVCAFSVNRKRNIIKMIKWGVDGIISDYPDRVKAALGYV